MNAGVRDKIQPLLREARAVALIARAPVEEAVFLARETLRGRLSERGIFAYLFPESPAAYEKKWSSVCAPSGPTPPRKAALRIAKKNCIVQELRYEEREDDFSIVVTPKTGVVKKDDIAVEPLLPDIDAVIAFSGEDRVIALAGGSLALPGRDRIVVITPDERTITEKAHELAVVIGPETLGKRDASGLFAALLLETKNFSQHVSETALALGSALLASGADSAYVLRTLAHSPNFLQLVGRALARTIFDETLGSAMTFVTAKDIEKTKHAPDPELARALLDEAVLRLRPERFAVLFWQDDQSVNVLAQASNPALRDSLAQRLGAVSNGLHVIAGGFRNFSEAEIKIRGVLRDIR